MYTLEDLEKAHEELDSWNDRWANYSGNNPNKYRNQISDAGGKVSRIKDHLKRVGVIEKSKKELFDEKLDKKFPDARSREVVEYYGKRYQLIFTPLSKSRSGKTVKRWGKDWVKLD